jgi:Tol biopolymer transport system component
MTEIEHLRVVATMAAVALAALLLALVGSGPADAAFQGQNGDIVFQRDGNIWLMGPRGVSAPSNTISTNLTPNTPSSQDVDPAMSPNGRKVAFTTNRDGDYEIFALDIYSGVLTKVTRNVVRDAQPAWSPNGQRIAYESPNVAGDIDIFSKNADGTGTAVDEVNIGGNQFTPSWSPDGDEIAFQDGPTNDVWLYDRATSFSILVASDGTASQDLLPNWSPDGSRIVFQSNRPAPDGSTDYEIYTARSSDGGDLRRLTNNAFDDGNAAYSPNGSRIVHNDYFSGNADILTRDSSNGSDPRLLLAPGTDDAAPDWGRVAPPAAPGCTISGTFARDLMTGTSAADTICSLGGNDEVDALDDNDTMKGGTGNDRLIGGGGRDSLLGSNGGDILDSRDGVNRNDSLNGGPGTDRCLKDARELAVRSCP